MSGWLQVLFDEFRFLDEFHCPSIGTTDGRVLSAIRSAVLITCNAGIVLLLILALFSVFFDFFFVLSYAFWQFMYMSL